MPAANPRIPVETQLNGRPSGDRFSFLAAPWPVFW